MSSSREKSERGRRPTTFTLFGLLLVLGFAPILLRAQQSPAPAPANQPGSANQPASSNSQTTAVPAPSSGRRQMDTYQLNPASVLRAQSNVVRIDVEVTDHNGKPIKGLRADQFSITDDGKLEKISSFSYADIESVEKAGKESVRPLVVPVDNPTPVLNNGASDAVADAIRNRRMIVLFFDLTSMETDDLIRAHDAAVKYLKQQMTAADLVAVVTYSSSLRVLANFTNDHAALNKAIAQLIPGVSSQLDNPLSAATQNGEYSSQQYTGDAFTADETEFNVFNTDQKLIAIEGLANTLQSVPGRKALVEFTGGITQTGEENRAELQAATDAANRADVSIYSIDARGMYATPPGGDATTTAATGTSMFTGASVFHQTDQREDSRDTLATLSTDTGGRAFFDLGDLSDAFPKIEQENGGYYLIGYDLPPDVKRDGTWHAVRVKVKASGAHVRYRTGYFAPRDFQHLQKEDRDQQIAEALTSDDPETDLPIAVETSVFRISDQQVYVPISAKLSSGALDWAQKHDRHEAVFDFAADVRTVPGAQSVAALRDTITVRLDQQTFAQVSRSNLVYQGGVVLAPGSYRLKFVARENESGKIGTFEENFTIPPRPAAKMTLSSVLLSSQLVPVEKSTEVETKGQGLKAKMTASPLEVAGEKIVPSVTRFFTQQQNLYVFFQAYYPEKLDSFDPQTLRAGLVFFRGGVQVNATPLLPPTQVDADTHTASFRMSLPLAKLPTGRYTVQAVVIAAGTQQSAFGRAYLALEQAPAAPDASGEATPTGAAGTPTANPPATSNP
jgi:VWFA-related protein